jgi:hypothetical protein
LLDGHFLCSSLLFSIFLLGKCYTKQRTDRNKNEKAEKKKEAKLSKETYQTLKHQTIPNFHTS